MMPATIFTLALLVSGALIRHAIKLKPAELQLLPRPKPVAEP
jgi:hypothetical protein